MSVYHFFPSPPGIEYFNSRNMYIDLNGPWTLEPTSYPMPAMPDSPVSFTEAADTFGLEIIKEMDAGKDVYVMWSGGIDSTATIVSILKYIKPAHAEQLYIVLSESSKTESPMFYHKFLKQYKQIDVSKFDPGTLNLHNSIIIDGEGGDQTFGSSPANRLFSEFPEKIMLPWRNNIDFLKTQWHKDSVPGFWDFFMDQMTTTIAQESAPVETLFDFYWWLNFNFKFDSVMFRHTLRLGENVADEDFKYFSTTVMRRMFAYTKMQQWSMSAGAVEKIYQAKKTVKWAGRKYIYEFDKNEYYFREKRKEFSSETIAGIATKYLAVDRDYNRFGVGDRAVRQDIGRRFF